MIMNEVYSPQRVTHTKKVLLGRLFFIEVTTDFHQNIFHIAKHLPEKVPEQFFLIVSDGLRPQRCPARRTMEVPGFYE